MLPTIITAIDRIKPDADILVKDFIDHYLGNAYHEHFRKYHNIEHITPMLDILDNVKHLCDDRDLIEFAWWYHDAIYIPGVSNCEKFSAKKAEYDCQRLGFYRKTIKKIHNLIMATEHSDRTGDIPNDEKIIHDIDLVILGQPPDRYKRYAQQIREEYFFIPDKEFKNGRAMIMSTFLKRKNIYYHESFQEDYEEAARKNIQMEIEELSK